jgi:hypothetical protein
MMYLHTPEYQLVLQAAVQLRHLRETDEEIALHSGVGSKMTIWRFRTAKLVMLKEGWEPGEEAAQPALSNVPGADIEPPAEGNSEANPQGRRRPRTLRLDYPVASNLWKYCSKEIRTVVQERIDLLGHTERLAANAINSFYRVHENQTIDWTEHQKLQEEYFCYKPAFREPGYVLKSHMRFCPMNDEYLEVSEKQVARDDDGGDSSEESLGFAFSKSERLWLFLREKSHDQPRVFCFYRKDVDAEGRIARLEGYLLESDKRYDRGVNMFRVGLVSVRRDQEIWRHEYPGSPYSLDEQTDMVPIPPINAVWHGEKRRVVFDQRILDYVRPSILTKPRGERAVGGWANDGLFFEAPEDDGGAGSESD